MSGFREHVQPGLESLQEGGDAAAERLAAGFAQHVERWARRWQADAAARDAPGADAATRAPTERDFAILRRAAHAVSVATSDGHVCLLLEQLSSLSASPGREGQDGEALALDELRESLLATGVVGTPGRPGACPLILDEDGRLYLHRYIDYEARLARRVMQAASAAPRSVTAAARSLLDSLFDPVRDGEADWQKIAAAIALRGSFAVISGGPGTGKTTTVVNLLACLLAQEPEARIALAAPTGKAAARMTEAIRQRAGHLPHELRARLPQEASTVHRLLGANPGQRRFTHDAGNPIPCDALVVDEASMLDLALATRLLEAAPASARIILLGDKDQLAAVEAGAVFAELSADASLGEACRRELAQLCGYPPGRIAPPTPEHPSPLKDATVWLTRNHRFPADSAIGRLARYINEGRVGDALALLRAARPGEAAAPLDPQPVRGVDAGKPSRPGRAAKKRDGGAASLALFPELDATSASPPASGPRAPDVSIRWLDPEQGDDPLEAMLAGYAGYFEAVRRDPADVPAIFDAFSRFRVLCALRHGGSGVAGVNEQVSQRARQAAGGPPAHQAAAWWAGRPVMIVRNDYTLKLFNGDIGIALPADGGLAVFFPDGDGRHRPVPVARLPAHETAFAMTVHKAQGSEVGSVLLMLPAQPSRVVTRELVYTAVTRATRRVTLCSSAGALAEAIRSKSATHSGLQRRMRDASQLPG